MTNKEKPSGFARSKKIDQSEPLELFNGPRSVRVESIPMETIRLLQPLDWHLVEELVESYKIDESDVKFGLVKAIKVGKDVKYELLTRPEEAEAFKKLGHTLFDVVAIYNDSDFSVEKASVKELLFLGSLGTAVSRLEEKTLIRSLEFDDGEEDVNASATEDEALFDVEHSDIVGGGVITKGQSSPLTAGAWIDAEKVFHRSVTDGLHRGKKLVAKKIRTVKVTMWYGWDEADIWMQRIQAAASVRSIALARFGIWSRKLYEKTEWYKREIAMSSIVSLAISDTSGKKLHLEGEDGIAAKAWARKMAKAFHGAVGIEIGSMLPYVRAFEHSFPQIIRKIRRAAGGGKEKRGILNPAKFTKLVELLPDDLEKQRVVADLNKEHNFNGQEFEMVALAISQTKEGTQRYTDIKMNPLRASERFLRSLRQKEDKSGQLGDKGRGHIFAKGSIFSFGDAPTGSRVVTMSGEAVDALRDAVRKPENAEKWAATPGLSEKEVATVQLFLSEGYSFIEIGEQLGVTESVAEKLFWSAATKINIHRRRQRLHG